jgi:poly(3-hydroxyoctanoate) depolymerase
MTMSAVDEMLRIDGRLLRVVASGDGAPVLLLNGIGAPMETWRPLLRHLGNTRAIAFDAPGSGASPAGQWPLSMRGHAELALRVLDHLDCHSASVLGFSFGGLVAQELARCAPKRVDRLVLASTSCGWGGVPGSLPALIGLGSPDRYASSTAFARSDSAAGADGAAATSAAPPATAPPMTSAAADRRGRFFQAVTAVMWSSAWWLWQIRQPTLVVTGDLDTVVPGVNSAILTTLLPTARLHVVRGGGHMCILEQASELGPTLRDFLGTSFRPRTGSDRSA